MRFTELIPCIAMLAAFGLAAVPVHAQLDRASIKQLDFDDTDYIRGEARRQVKDTYFVGEPVIFDLRLFNHTKHPVTLRTNFIPNSNLKVSITRFGYASTIPFDGGYGSSSMHGQRIPKLLPQEMLQEYLLIWGDTQTPGHLVFSQPGEYIIKLSIEVEVIEGKDVIGDVSLGEHRIRVVNTPNEFKAQVEKLKEWGVFGRLALGIIPPDAVEKVAAMLEDTATYPVNRITPYLHYALGNQLAKRWEAIREIEDFSKSEKKKLIDKALYHLQISARSDSVNTMLSYQALLTLLDKLGQTQFAYQCCMEMLKEMPDDLVGKIGNSELVQKYLIHGTEIDPTETWTLSP